MLSPCLFNLYAEYSGRRQWHPTPVLLPGKSHGWRSLVGSRPWGREESDTTERLHFHFSLSCIREGNGNPLQCSCLENPRDPGSVGAGPRQVATEQGPQEAILKELSRHEPRSQQAISMELSSDESCCSTGNNQARE